MDELRLGVALRSARVARRLRQCDVAVAARVSDSTVSRIERGRIRRVSVGALISVAAALEIQLRFRPVARSGDLDRIVNARHTALVEAVIARLAELDWRCQAEVSFSKWGERGSIDILALHPATGALLVIEAKTEIVDVGEILSVLDRKRRLALEIARDLGWDRPRSASVALIVADARTNRRRAAAVRSTLRSALPDDGRRLRGYVCQPTLPVRAIAFWSIRHPRSTKPSSTATRRVRRANRRPAVAHSSVEEAIEASATDAGRTPGSEFLT